MYVYVSKKRNFIDLKTRKIVQSQFLDQYELGEKVTKFLDDKLADMDPFSVNTYLYIAYYQLLYKYYSFDYMLPRQILENSADVFNGDVALLPKTNHTWFEKKQWYCLPDRFFPPFYWMQRIKSDLSFRSNKFFTVTHADMLAIIGHPIHDDICSAFMKYLPEYSLAYFPELEHTIRHEIENPTFERHINEDMQALWEAMPVKKRIVQRLIRDRISHYYRVLSHYHPKIVLSFNEPHYDAGIVCYVASLLNIRTVNVAHAISIGWQRRHSPYDFHLVYGQSSVDYLRAGKGLILGELEPVGAPRFDHVLSYESVQFQDSAQSGKKRIVIFSDSTDEGFIDFKFDYLKLLQSYFELNNVGLEVLVKKHPRETAHWEEVFLGKFPFVKFSDGTRNNADLIDWADSVLVCQIISTSGIEVILRNRLLGIINRADNRDVLKYQQFETAFIIKSEKDISEFLEMSANDVLNDRYRKFLDYHIANRGHAAEQIATFIEPLMHKE